MQPTNMILTPHTSGDTWEGKVFGPILLGGVQPTYTLESCRMYFRHTINGRVYWRLNSDSSVSRDGTITITDSTTWLVTIPEQVLDLETGTYFWDFETVDANGAIRTLYKGTLFITPEVSNDDFLNRA